jgi:crotonobetainyl-CoA:carnitine CoA-transferase CaiB-like acyl-CoA transferase
MDHRCVRTGWYAPYNGVSCDAEDIIVTACAPDEWKIFTEEEGEEWASYETYSRELDYNKWPRGFGFSST